MIGLAPGDLRAEETSDPARTETMRLGARRELSGVASVVLFAVMAFSVVVGFFGAFAYGLSGIQEQRSQQQLYDSFRGLLDPSSPLAPSIGGVIKPGTPVSLLSSPAAGLRQVVVVEGTSSSQLLSGPGHLPDTPLPGQLGDSVLVGKAVTADGPFSGIDRLRRGDAITVRTGQGKFHYVVVDERTAGDRLPALPKSGSMLTLVSAAGSGFLGSLAPSHLVYVDADLVGHAVAAPAGRPVSVPPSNAVGDGDESAWPFVIFWLQGLLVFAIGAVWLWTRWGRWQTWLVAAPVLCGVLWGLSTEVMRLLPNVY